MSFFGNVDFGLEVSKGNVPQHSATDKFGKALDCDSDVATDIWDGADGTTSTDVWVPPTQARIHNLASTSAADASAGTGMQTIRVFGLTDWDTAEVSEDITLNGVTNVATSNSYVIIHRMFGLTWGSGEANAGIITATAVTDATITAAIQAGNNQTLMSIYGVPSTKTFFLAAEPAITILRATASVSGDGVLLVKNNPDVTNSGYLVKRAIGVGSSAPSQSSPLIPAIAYAGPCIIKLQITTGTNNSEATGFFNGYLVDN